MEFIDTHTHLYSKSFAQDGDAVISRAENDGVIRFYLPAIDSDGKPATIAFLIDHLCMHLLKDPRTDLFVLDKHMYVS